MLTKICLIDEIILRKLGRLAHNPNINIQARPHSMATILHHPIQTSIVDSTLLNVEVVPHVALHELRCLLAEGHARQQVGHALLDRGIGAEVELRGVGGGG